MVIKRITAANPNLTSGRSRTEAQNYWAKTHGHLVANNPNLRRYHHYFSPPEAYALDEPPTWIGISMFWRDNPFVLPGEVDPNSPQGIFQKFYQNQPLGSDDRQLFDREKRWPIDDQHCDILGEEHVIIDGQTRPMMINAIFMVNKKPGLDHKEFFAHWIGDHAELAKKIPGLRRYIQNHLVLDFTKHGGMTHDGWSEFWFDDLDAYKAARRSPEWAAMDADGKTLFSERRQCVIGQEYVQKDESWKPRDYGALTMTEDEIRAKLREQGYGHLVDAEPDVAARLKASAAKGKIAVWTPYHLASYDEPWIDARPKRTVFDAPDAPGDPALFPLPQEGRM